MMIPDELYRQIRRMMPIPCVDLLVTDDGGHVLLVRRKCEPAKGAWWFPGGRVHFGETRLQAAVRKLRDECGLEASAIEEIATFDVILELPAAGTSSHGITTLVRMRVGAPRTCRLDSQSTQAAWRTPGEWAEERLHAFVRKGMSHVRGSQPQQVECASSRRAVSTVTHRIHGSGHQER
jgi:ADP-ribose pyrophosphatase YjhB (NUDIX family)